MWCSPQRPRYHIVYIGVGYRRDDFAQRQSSRRPSGDRSGFALRRRPPFTHPPCGPVHPLSVAVNVRLRLPPFAAIHSFNLHVEFKPDPARRSPLQGIQTIIAGNEVFGIDYLLTRLASNRAQKLIYSDHNMQLSFPAQILSIPFLWNQFPNLKQVVVRIR